MSAASAIRRVELALAASGCPARAWSIRPGLLGLVFAWRPPTGLRMEAVVKNIELALGEPVWLEVRDCRGRLAVGPRRTPPGGKRPTRFPPLSRRKAFSAS